MKTPTPSVAWSFATLYVLTGLWHGLWLAALASGPGFFTNLHLFWGLLFVIIPVPWVYTAARMLLKDRRVLSRHPIVATGLLAFVFLPPLTARLIRLATERLLL